VILDVPAAERPMLAHDSCDHWLTATQQQDSVVAANAKLRPLAANGSTFPLMLSYGAIILHGGWRDSSSRAEDKI
jgi:hypothetical protein